jgi:hypothetical protein
VHKAGPEQGRQVPELQEGDAREAGAQDLFLKEFFPLFFFLSALLLSACFCLLLPLALPLPQRTAPLTTCHSLNCIMLSCCVCEINELDT